jgi:hypothetical protein
LIEAYEFFRFLWKRQTTLDAITLLNREGQTIAQWDAGNGESISVNHADGDRIRRHNAEI